MSEVFDALLTRRSVRKYKPEMPPKEAIEQIVLAGTYAASGMGKQSPIILAVTNPEVRAKLEALNGEISGRPNPQFYGAPVALVVLADKNVPTYVYDGSLVIGNMMLAAHDLGLGSCWVHRAKQTFETEYGKELLASLGIEGEYEGIGNLIVGYADDEIPSAKPRKENWVYFVE